MKIEVAKLRDEPIVLEEAVAASQWGMDNYDARFTGDIFYHCSFARYGNEILVDVAVDLTYDATCSRCLKESKEAVHREFQLNYNVLTVGDTLVVDDDVREQVLLDHPMRFLCKEDCKGICPGCGVDLNTDRCKCCGGKK